MAEKLGVHINWKGRVDHLDPVLQDYQACTPLASHMPCCAEASCLMQCPLYAGIRIELEPAESPCLHSCRAPVTCLLTERRLLKNCPQLVSWP